MERDDKESHNVVLLANWNVIMPVGETFNGLTLFVDDGILICV
jgi:hypothetical protein